MTREWSSLLHQLKLVSLALENLASQEQPDSREVGVVATAAKELFLDALAMSNKHGEPINSNFAAHELVPELKH